MADVTAADIVPSEGIVPSALPIVQAPMAGGPSTPRLTAAATEAGAFGYLAAGYLTVDALRAAIDETRMLINAPFGVNVFVPARDGDADTDLIRTYAETLQPEADRLGVALGSPRWDDDGYADKIALLTELAVHSVSFTFGCPSEADVEQLHHAGSRVLVTVTSPAEAEQAAAVGADAVIVQGTEAGGHQGRFIGIEPNTTPLLAALTAIRDVGLPMIATGGISTGRDARAALNAGAVAAAIGTALLDTPEAGTSAVYRRALRDQLFADTVITRAYTGRYARGLANRFAREHPDAPSGYPQIHYLTRPLRAAATAADDTDVPNLWAGTGWRTITSEPAAAVIRRIAADARP